MSASLERNKALVLEAMTSLFQRKDASAARLWPRSCHNFRLICTTSPAW
jgi:hypothetical protein